MHFLFEHLRSRVNRRWAAKLVILLALALARSTFAGTNDPAWPPPPAEPYIIYVGSITCPSDIGVAPPILTRIGRLITGATGAKESLVRPFGLALDDAGHLLVTDTGANAVCCLDRSRKKWQRWEKVGDVRFASPVAVARQGDTIFVADSALGKVIAFTEKGKVKFEITRELERPCGLALLGDKLFIADSQRHQIDVCDLRGKLLWKFGHRGAGSGEFNYPTHIGTDAASHVYVTDSLNFRIQVFDSAGQFGKVIGGLGDTSGYFSRPKGVAVDRAGHIYAVDALFDNIQIFDGEGHLLLDWGAAGSDPGEFWLPNGIAISRKNEIYVADAYNRRIQVFQYVKRP